MILHQDAAPRTPFSFPVFLSHAIKLETSDKRVPESGSVSRN